MKVVTTLLIATALVGAETALYAIGDYWATHTRGLAGTLLVCTVCAITIGLAVYAAEHARKKGARKN